MNNYLDVQEPPYQSSSSLHLMDKSSLPKNKCSCPLIDKIRNLKHIKVSTTNPRTPIPRNRSPSVNSTDPRRRGNVLDATLTKKEKRSLNNDIELTRYWQRHCTLSHTSSTPARQAGVSFEPASLECNLLEFKERQRLKQYTPSHTSTTTMTQDHISGTNKNRRYTITQGKRTLSQSSNPPWQTHKKSKNNSLDSSSQKIHPITTSGSRFVETGILHQDQQQSTGMTPSTKNTTTTQESTEEHTQKDEFHLISYPEPLHNRHQPHSSNRNKPLPQPPIFLHRTPRNKPWATTPLNMLKIRPPTPPMRSQRHSDR